MCSLMAACCREYEERGCGTRIEWFLLCVGLVLKLVGEATWTAAVRVVMYLAEWFQARKLVVQVH